jgi:hypothetical protein
MGQRINILQPHREIPEHRGGAREPAALESQNFERRQTLDSLRHAHHQPGGRGGTAHHFILQSKHHLMTAGMVHVTNLTPGSDNPTRGRSR